MKPSQEIVQWIIDFEHSRGATPEEIQRRWIDAPSFMVVHPSTLASREAEMKFWLDKLNKAADGDIRDTLPGLTAFNVRQREESDGLVFQFKFWFGDGLTEIHVWSSRELLEDQVFTPFDPYDEIVRKTIERVRAEHN